MPYVMTFRVKGSGQFPMDMLRYSNCKPKTECDAESVKALPADWPGPREIELVRIAPNIGAVRFVAEERWKAFGWEVLRSAKPFHTRLPEDQFGVAVN